MHVVHRRFVGPVATVWMLNRDVKLTASGTLPASKNSKYGPDYVRLVLTIEAGWKAFTDRRPHRLLVRLGHSECLETGDQALVPALASA